MVALSETRHTAAPLKDMADKGNDDQSGQLDAQEDTKSTATIQGCMSRESNMGLMLQLSTILVGDAEKCFRWHILRVKWSQSRCPIVSTLAALASSGGSFVQ